MLYILLVLLEAVFIGIGRSFIPMHVGIMAVICLILNFPLAYIILKICLKNESKSPYGKLNAEFMKEMRTNGYTDKNLAMAEQVIADLKAGADINFIYLKDFAIYTADYYNLNGDYAKASEYLSVVDEHAIAGKDIMFIDGGLTVLMYYMTKMETLRGLKDTNGALDLIGVSKAVLGNKKRTDMQNILLDHIEYHGWMTLGDLGKAGEAASRLLNYDSQFAKDLTSVYFINADYQICMGDRAKAMEYMDIARNIIETKTPALRFCYEGMMKKLGLG